MPYEYTHITYRERNDDGDVSACVTLADSKREAAELIGSLVLNPAVFALRYIHYGEEPDEPPLDPAQHAGATSYTDVHTRIGPPITP